MLSHRFYYAFKPFVPWRVRMAGRRILARYKRKAHLDSWPVDERAAVAPPDWTGWPEQKKFSFVITHDVEGPEGLAKCRQLAELEMKHGFRSSFNFIPEGPYQVPEELRAWLTANGFEVGVHDLNHDGKLFTSKNVFTTKAKRINHYLREWQASGYRSGFMLRNLDWLHDLSIGYDSSTFDTDPFEPQPDGVSTIFPYWIPSPEPHRSQVSGFSSQSGYVELPYTLPQDSTLFLVLQEQTPDIWLNKLTWIAGHGGMALVNVHPDYINFGDTKRGSREYDAGLYIKLLSHVSAQYQGVFWHPLPRDLAHWFRSSGKSDGVRPSVVVQAPELQTPEPEDVSGILRGKRATVLLYSQYPADPRPRRAAEAMIAAGMEVDLLCLADSKSSAPREVVRGVNVFRVPLKHRRDRKWLYLWQYGRFFTSSVWFLTSRSLRHRYDVVHVHNMPDFLVFAALVPKLRGARLILDLHDPMPELMESIYGLKTDDLKVKILRWLEKWSIAFADLALTPNITFRNLFVARSCRPEKMQIVMNSPQQEIFDPDLYAQAVNGADQNGEFRVMHHGSIVHRHGVDLLVEAVARLRPKIPGIRLEIYGSSTPFLDTVLTRAGQLGIADIVRYHGAKNQAEIARAILDCHVGVVPNRRSAFIEINFPTRLFEYLALHRPVVAPSTQGIRDYFSPEQILLFEPNDVADLAARILWVKEHPAESQQVVRAGIEVYRQHLWFQEKKQFVQLVAGLCRRA